MSVPQPRASTAALSISSIVSGRILSPLIGFGAYTFFAGSTVTSRFSTPKE